MTRLLLAVLVFSLALILGACAQSSPGGATNDAGTGTETLVPDVQPEAVLEAQQELSETLGVPVEEIKIVQVEQTDWPNACLGLANEGEMCAEVITPGYEVTFEYQGKQYEFRTNDIGDIIRRAQ